MKKMNFGCNIPRLVIWFIGIFAIISLLFYGLLSYVGKAPEGLQSLASYAVGALGAILSTTGRSNDPIHPVAVTVENKESDPVPTSDQTKP